MHSRSRYFAGLRARLGQWVSGQNYHIVDLVRGASIAGVLKALAAILAFGLSVVLGRALGAEASGVYFLALTTATVAATIGRAGLDSTVVRFIAGHASAGRWADVRSVYRYSLNITLICSCVAAATLYLLAAPLADVVFLDPNLATPIRLMAVSVVPLSLGVLVSRALLALSCIRDSLLVYSILPSGVALAATWVLAVLWNVNGAIVAYVVAVSVAFVYGWIAWRRTLAERASAHDTAQTEKLTRELLRSGAPLLIGALLQLVMLMSGTLMLGIWSDNVAVSQFALASRTALLITFVLVAVNTVAQPKFAELYARGDMESLATTAYKATLLMTACAAPVVLVFLVAPEFVMSAFGAEFAGSGAALQILSIGQFVNVATGSVGILLVMSGQEREYRNVQIVAACVVLALNIALIPAWGAVGAAIATAAALIVQNVLFGYFVWIKLGIVTIMPRAHRKRSTGGS